MRKYFPRGIKASGGIGIDNEAEILTAMSGRDDGLIDDDPYINRLGVDSYLTEKFGKSSSEDKRSY